MTPVDRSVLERKLDAIRTNLKDVKTILAKGIDSYLNEHFDRKVMERSLQLIIEAAVDTNLHILKERYDLTPEESAQSFAALAENSVLPRDLAEALAPSVGLRNRIVHQYDVLDSKRVFSGAEKALQLFPRYVGEILKNVLK